MKNNILEFINKLEGYRVAIKNFHWASNNMSEHKLCDDIAESLADSEDKIAEACQGLFGKFKPNEIKVKEMNLSSTKALIESVIIDCNKFHGQIGTSDYIGVRAIVEEMIANFNKFNYLIDFCMKEGRIKVKRSDLRSIVEHIVRQKLSESEYQDYPSNNSSWPKNCYKFLDEDGDEVKVDSILSQILVDHFYQLEDFITVVDGDYNDQRIHLFDVAEKYGNKAYEQVVKFIESESWVGEYEKLEEFENRQATKNAGKHDDSAYFGDNWGH